MHVVPDREDFLSLSRRGNLIPVYAELLADTLSPVEAYLRLQGQASFLLESVEGGEKWGRYSFLGLAPSFSISIRAQEVELRGPGGTEHHRVENPLEFLRQFMAQFRPVEVEGLERFWGGLVGYLGYDMVRFMEDLGPLREKPSLGMPDAYLMLTDTMVVFDALKQKARVLANIHLQEAQEPLQAYERAVQKLRAVIQALQAPRESLPLPVLQPLGKPREDFSSSFGPPEAFMQAVERAKAYVHSGDVVQVVLSQRFERPSSARPLDIYRALRLVNPSPYMFYLDTPAGQLIGSSPEILVRLEGRHITLRPIAGTRRRGRTEEEDQALEAELRADPKEQAEHIMLVDLGRNDVGRVAQVGSVRVQELMSLERYSHVMHLVSSVVGTLRQGLGAFDVLKACFPAGTVTGAPKVRAMQIIDELEPLKRGPYAGAVGYISYSGNMDTCITIRTLIIRDGRVYVQAGAGVVADSVPAMEHKETLNKAMAMMKAVQMAEALF
jgi:anthranilate synthase component 1